MEPAKAHAESRPVPVVSQRLRRDFGNGCESYARDGTAIDLPDRRVEYPDRDAITWHLDTVFKGA
ncbi:MAG: hypothetical protein QM638_18965 [Nocardioides sp.]|uniref:hypothetical protein n=1 Tax=Nocardioides sp. TaxID=35761 RepID=UPI0039E33266